MSTVMPVRMSKYCDFGTKSTDKKSVTIPLFSTVLLVVLRNQKEKHDRLTNLYLLPAISYKY